MEWEWGAEERELLMALGLPEPPADLVGSTVQAALELVRELAPGLSVGPLHGSPWALAVRAGGNKVLLSLPAALEGVEHPALATLPSRHRILSTIAHSVAHGLKPEKGLTSEISLMREALEDAAHAVYHAHRLYLQGEVESSPLLEEPFLVNLFYALYRGEVLPIATELALEGKLYSTLGLPVPHVVDRAWGGVLTPLFPEPEPCPPLAQALGLWHADDTPRYEEVEALSTCRPLPSPLERSMGYVAYRPWLGQAHWAFLEGLEGGEAEGPMLRLYRGLGLGRNFLFFTTLQVAKDQGEGEPLKGKDAPPPGPLPQLTGSLPGDLGYLEGLREALGELPPHLQDYYSLLKGDAQTLRKSPAYRQGYERGLFMAERVGERYE